jgi:hypothetical protein
MRERFRPHGFRAGAPAVVPSNAALTVEVTPYGVRLPQDTGIAWQSMDKAVYDELMTQGEDEEPLDLARRVADAVAAGDRAEAIRLTRELEGWLVDSGAGKSLDGHAPTFMAPPAVVPVKKRPSPSRSSRQVVAGALAEIGVPCRVKVVADYAEARFGERIEPRALAALRRDERRAWGKSSARPVYIVPALEGRYYQPVRGLLTLSDWPLERRVVGPWSERADHLTATAQLARQLAWLSERDSAVAERLAPVVAGMAQSIPGALDGREVDTARVESAAEAERSPLAERDEPWRREAAARARAQLTEEQQLWGTSIGVVAQDDR